MIRYFFKLALSLGLFLWLIWSGEIRFQSFRQLGEHRSYLLLVFASQGILFLLAAARWRILVRRLAMDVSYFQILKFFLMGEFFSLFFLGAMGGDLSRMMLLGSNEPERKPSALLTVLIDKAMALWTLCGISLTALLACQPPAGRVWVHSMKLILAFPLAAVPVVLLLLRLIPATWLSFISKAEYLQPVLEAQTRMAHLPLAVFLKIGLLNLLAQALVIFNFVSCAFALGVFHIPFSVFFIVVPLGFLALAMPFSIGGLGVGQLAFAELFKVYGVTEEALGGNLSTLHIAVWSLYALLGGGLFAASKPKSLSLAGK